MRFKKLGQIELILFVLGVIYASLSTNFLISLSAITVPFILIRLLWKENESPLLLFAFLMQWLAITIKVFYANYANTLFDDIDLHRYPDFIEKAYYLALGGLVSMALGAHLVIRSFNLQDNKPMLYYTKEFNKNKLIRLYILTIIATPILLRLSFSLGGLQQPVTKIIEYKWSLFYIFLLYSFENNSAKIFISIFLIEFILSLTGFFSAFKDYFLVGGIGITVIYKNRFKISYLLPCIVLIIGAIYMLIAWSYIKPAYRAFLNEGTSKQINLKSNTESLSKIIDLTTSIDSTAIKEGFESIINRISYIDFLSGTLSNVPSQVAHTEGELWKGALEKVLKPRLFFPGKAAIDDSEKARLYTGSTYAGADQGTSISLGYYAESYVDFGETGMIYMLFVFGLLIGFIYRYVMIKSPNILIGTALLIPFFFTIYGYEKALDKIFAALFLYLIVYIIIKSFFLEKILAYLRE
jgi:hypothetical protein